MKRRRHTKQRARTSSRRTREFLFRGSRGWLLDPVLRDDSDECECVRTRDEGDDTNESQVSVPEDIADEFED